MVSKKSDLTCNALKSISFIIIFKNIIPTKNFINTHKSCVLIFYNVYKIFLT